MEECAELFASMNAYLTGIQCPLEMLEQRELNRKDRTLGQARLQYDVIHRYTCYDLEVDTSILFPEHCAQNIIECLQLPPTDFRQLAARK